MLERLRKTVKSGRFSQREIARESGVSPAAISDVVRGKHGLRVVTAEKIAAALDRLEQRESSEEAAAGNRGATSPGGAVA